MFCKLFLIFVWLPFAAISPGAGGGGGGGGGSSGGSYSGSESGSESGSGSGSGSSSNSSPPNLIIEISLTNLDMKYLNENSERIVCSHFGIFPTKNCGFSYFGC